MSPQFPKGTPHLVMQNDGIMVTVWRAPISPEEFTTTIEPLGLDNTPITHAPRTYIWTEPDEMGIAGLAERLAALLDPTSRTAQASIDRLLRTFLMDFYPPAKETL